MRKDQMQNTGLKIDPEDDRPIQEIVDELKADGKLPEPSKKQKREQRKQEELKEKNILKKFIPIDRETKDIFDYENYDKDKPSSAKLYNTGIIFRVEKVSCYFCFEKTSNITKHMAANIKRYHTGKYFGVDAIVPESQIK